jgi:hypothetical protein
LGKVGRGVPCADEEENDVEGSEDPVLDHKLLVLGSEAKDVGAGDELQQARTAAPCLVRQQIATILKYEIRTGKNA